MSYTPTSYGSGGSINDGYGLSDIISSKFTPLKKVIGMLERLEADKQYVALKEQELKQAQQVVGRSEIELYDAIRELDPATREILNSITSFENSEEINKKGLK